MTSPGAFLKELAAGMGRALCGQLGSLHAELAQQLGRGNAQLLVVAGHRLGEALLLLGVERDLHGGVAVLLGGLDLAERVAGHIDDGDGDHGAGLLVEDAGHANLFTNKS